MRGFEVGFPAYFQGKRYKVAQIGWLPGNKNEAQGPMVAWLEGKDGPVYLSSLKRHK